MFIVWRKRAIKTDRPVELFRSYDEAGPVYVLKEHGKTERVEMPRRITWNEEPWLLEPVYCRHKGPGRVTWTPLLMHSERVDGKPRQELIRAFYAIRSCCMADPFILAGWWYEIGQWERFTKEDAWRDTEGLCFARDRKAIRAKLREVVPVPSRKAIAAFTEFRLKKEEEYRRAESERDQREMEEQQRRQEQHRQEEQKRQRQQRQAREQFNWAFGARAGELSWWQVLGLLPTATREQIDQRYRELARQHHPDRGGDEATFKRVQIAYQKAKAMSG